MNLLIRFQQGHDRGIGDADRDDGLDVDVAQEQVEERIGTGLAGGETGLAAQVFIGQVAHRTPRQLGPVGGRDRGPLRGPRQDPWRDPHAPRALALGDPLLQHPGVDLGGNPLGPLAQDAGGRVAQATLAEQRHLEVGHPLRGHPERARDHGPHPPRLQVAVERRPQGARQLVDQHARLAQPPGHRPRRQMQQRRQHRWRVVIAGAPPRREVPGQPVAVLGKLDVMLDPAGHRLDDDRLQGGHLVERNLQLRDDLFRDALVEVEQGERVDAKERIGGQQRADIAQGSAGQDLQLVLAGLPRQPFEHAPILSNTRSHVNHHSRQLDCPPTSFVTRVPPSSPLLHPVKVPQRPKHNGAQLPPRGIPEQVGSSP